MSDNLKAIGVRVTGRVQGVGFRDWTRREAMHLGLTGWVRNEPDGSVEARLVGSDDAIAIMLERMHRGPTFAQVTCVASEPAAIDKRPVDFRITR